MSADLDPDRLYALFDRACDLAPSERTEFINQSCIDEPAMAERLHELVDGLDNIPEDFLSGASASTHPKQIGPYQILGELGRGGMGVVYKAQQEHPKRMVALKVIRQGFANQEMLRRFERETQLLGRLQHPGIAHIYEAGSATVGDERWPYFAMELIDGRPIHTYLQTRGADTQECLELFAKVCDAVDHAHQQGVVHRDLKPQNILVRTADSGQPELKILDFGIARLTDPDSRNSTIRTQTGQILGTVGYMSPEQLSGDPGAVEPRIDVYALGVLLYRLLSGRLPYELQGKHLAEVVRIVHDEEPTRLSSQNTTLRGDLETIVGKAMERVSARRYASAAELAQDVRRFLKHEPITARAPSALYRASKFAKRNKPLVGGIATAFLALLIGLGIATAGFFSASRERDAKERALQSSRAVTRFLSETLEAANPNKQGKDVTVRAVLDRARGKLDQRFSDQPLVLAQLKTTIGKTYSALGEYPEALKQLQAALKLWTQLAGPHDPKTLEAKFALGETQYHLRAYEDAYSTLEPLVRHLSAKPNKAPQLLILAICTLSGTTSELGRYDESLRLLERGRTSSAFEPDSFAGMELAGTLAMLHVRRRENRKANTLLRDLLERNRKVLGAEHPSTLITMSNLAMTLSRLEKHKEALALYEEALELQERVQGKAHESRLITLNHLAKLLSKVGRHEEAKRRLREGMENARVARGDVPLYLNHALAIVQQRAGELDRSEATMRENVSRYEAKLGPNADGTLRVQVALLKLLLQRNKHEEAIARASAILARPALPPEWQKRLGALRDQTQDRSVPQR